MKLGIVPERIAAGHPEQNGRHERMHRTLKQETAEPPAANRRAQQRAFDRFRQEYNEQRPHEALGHANAGRGVCAVAALVSGAGTGAGVSDAPCWCAVCIIRASSAGRSTRCFSVRCCGENGSACCRSMNAGLRSTSPQFPIALFDSQEAAGCCRCPRRKISISLMQGKGTLPLPLHPIPSVRGGKSVRDVPGLKCQECPRPYRYQLVIKVQNGNKVCIRGRVPTHSRSLRMSGRAAGSV